MRDSVWNENDIFQRTYVIFAMKDKMSVLLRHRCTQINEQATKMVANEIRTVYLLVKSRIVGHA